MRSVSFQRPLEYQLVTETEEWTQGDFIRGTLRIANNGGESTPPQVAHVILAHALKKDLKAGDANWQVFERVEMEVPALSAQEAHIGEWELHLPSESPITDKSGALHLVFGNDEALETGGRIDLQVTLHPILQSFLQTFTTQFKFLEKYQKSVEGWTEVKLVPPDSREYPQLDELLLQFRILQERLEIRYGFRVRSLKREGESMKVRRKKKEVEQALDSTEYLLPGGFPNRNLLRESIDAALEEVRSGF